MDNSVHRPASIARAPAALRDKNMPQDHFVSAGESKFDRRTYRDVGYIANALLSVVAVFWAERTHGGQRTMSRFADWVRNVSHFNPDTARMLATKSFFLTGGFAVLLPMKWLEDQKTELVKKWNREIYGDKADTDPTLLQSQRELEAAPKQSWASIFSGRVLALIPFYITVGWLWDRKSPLSQATNSKLRAMSSDAITTMEHNDPAKFSQLASKGFYFDRPIAAVSRLVGKAAAWATGNKAAVEKIAEMETTYPGMIKQAAVGSTDRDPVHSTVPYYFISEAITSGIVAWGVYQITRFTGPLFSKRHSVEPVTTPSEPLPRFAPPPEVSDTRPTTRVMVHEASRYAPRDMAQAR
jgi:hypothetical protein